MFAIQSEQVARRSDAYPDAMLNVSERQWIERIQSGDHTAFEALFKVHYEVLCDAVEYYVSNSEIAEELVQDIFADIWRRRRDWNPRHSIKAYLHGAARNKAIKHRKRRQVRLRWEEQQQYEPEPVSASPEQIIEYSELEQIIQSSIEDMPPRRREIYRLSRQYGLSHKEISVALRISTKTVENQIGHALRFLRERIALLQYMLL